MPSLWSWWTQYFPPCGALTESTLPNQSGKVFIVTGGSTGLGYELTQILYGAGAKVYVLTRSKERAEAAFSRIQQAHHKTHNQRKRADLGTLHFIHMDMTDLFTVKAAAQEFLRREDRLDVLFNNAGTAWREEPPPTAQGHEFHFSVNVLGAFLLTRLLLPVLNQTAAAPGVKKDSVRVVWSASIMVDLMSPPGGVRKEFLQDTCSAPLPPGNELYSASKAANWFVASEFMRRRGDSDVVQIAGNPGNYNSDIWRDTSWLLYLVLWPILRDPVHGAHTYLWMGLSGEVTMQDAVEGRYAIPEGRWHPGQREDLLLALRGAADGGSGRAAEVWDWCEERVSGFLL